MNFTMENWASELEVMRQTLTAQPDEDVARNMLKGLCYLGYLTTKDNPGQCPCICNQVGEAFAQFDQVMGHPWVAANLQVVNNHVPRADLEALVARYLPS